MEKQEISAVVTVFRTDTLETNWFTVGDEANLMLKSIGKNAGLVSAFVERRSDGERFAVQLRTSDDTTALWTGYHYFAAA